VIQGAFKTVIKAFLIDKLLRLIMQSIAILTFHYTGVNGRCCKLSKDSQHSAVNREITII